MTKWGGQGGHITHVASNTFQSACSQLQSVVERVRLVHLGQVLSVGLQDTLLLVDNGVGHGQQYLVALLVAQ